MSSPVNEVKPSEVVQLKRSRDALCGVIVELQEQIKHLKADNDELKTKLIKVPKGTMNYSYMKDMETEIEQLKAEIERLKKEWHELKDWYNDRESESSERLMMRKKQVATLKGEIKKLEEQLDRYPEGAAGYTGDEFDELVSVKEEIDKLKERKDEAMGLMRKTDEENDYLHKEIKKLKQFAMKVHNFAFCTKYDDEDIVSSFDLDAILEEMKKDEDKLKNENEAMVKTLPNDMDGYGFDTTKMRWVHCDEEEEEEEEEDEDLRMVMFEGKEYYVDIYDDDVYDTSHEIVGSWDGKKIIFEEDTENIVKDVVNDIIDEVLDKSLP